MRTGAIFARGSCRALKWMALAGMVFALGAGQAVAQAKPNAPVLTTVEGVSGMSVKLTWTVPGGSIIDTFATQTRDADDDPFAAGDDGMAVGDSNAATREATITIENEQVGERVSYRVGAVNTVGTTWSNVLDYTTEAAPGKPTFSTPGGVTTGDGQVTLTWVQADIGGDADYYEYNSTDEAAFDDDEWMRVPGGSGARSVIITGLMNGEAYLVGVRAVNRGGPSGFVSETVTPSGLPGAPTDLTATLGTPAAGKVDVTLAWTEPESDGGSPIVYYEYEIDGFRNWTPTPTQDASTFAIIPGLDAEMADDYMYRVRALNANGAGPATDDPAGPTRPTGPTGPTGPTTTGDHGQIINTQLVGASVEPKTIGARRRTHVPEGANDVELEVTIELSNDEITALGKTHAEVDVQIMEGSSSGSLPNWLSPIDEEGDVDFPNANQPAGRLSGTVRIKLPTVGATARGSVIREASGTLSILLPEDNHEAESDAFYIEVIGSDDISLDDSRQADMMTLDVVIEDNDPQTVTVKRGASVGGSANPTALYEGVDTAFTITATPPRVELPLSVELDMLDLAGVTVSAAEISLETASVTLNADRSGSVAGNSEDVTVHLPASDGNRVDNYYQLQASVNVYSLQAGGFDDIAVYAHHVKVLDVHKLPWLTVSPVTGSVMEGGMMELTLTIDRNPANTIATDPETIQYTQEALNIMVSANADSTAGASDFTITPMPVPVPERKTGAFKQTVMVMVEAAEDDDIDMETLVLDFVAMGTVADNGPRRPADAPDYDAQAMLTIDDETEALVSVKADAYDTIKAALGDPPMMYPDMAAMLMGSDLFDYDATAVSVTYGTSVDGGAVTASASDGTVTIMGVSTGDAKVTITATATPNASSLEINQTKANVAQLTFPVTVSTPVPALPVIAQLLLAAFLGLGGIRRYYLRR